MRREMEKINGRTYFLECKSIAADVIKETRERNLDASVEELVEAIRDCLWETIESHEWVIYTHCAQRVLVESQNDGYAASPEGFGVEVVKDGMINWSMLAFGAMYADVSEILWPLFDEQRDLTGTSDDPE